MSRHRRRALALGAIAALLVVAGLFELGRGSAPPRRGPVATEVVAVRNIPAGARITADALGVVRVPARYAVRGAVVDPRAAIGLRAAVALPGGGLLMEAEVSRGERLAEARDVAVRLDDAAGLPSGDLAGTHADVVLVPTRGETPAIVLADVLVIAARTSDGAAVATLRLPQAEVAAVVAAEGRGSLRLAVRASPGAA
ncbi:MAG TPA: SAF domain-containing protein [Gaiellales bacterium]|nr:SAF domain-containing protein [Gaiellales bacterium]